MKILVLSLTGALALVSFSASTEARTDLGTGYFDIGGAFYDAGSDSGIDTGFGGFARLAVPVSRFVDLHAEATFTRSDGGIDVDQTLLRGGVTVHGTNDKFRPFGSIEIGQDNVKFSIGSGSVKADTFVALGTVGVEFVIGPKFSLTPSLAYVYYDDLEGADGLLAGLDANFKASTKMGIVAGFVAGEEDVLGRIGVRFKF
ncbi:hypothetical protein ASA1KI_22320 [Opitutales bacterium ASA1]|uniref:outer membrane beta-barrel protein n=1 Tax=Congregicoccus parvus TaxID=3081749 RepID=UPI002B2D89C5|nr:hypothetical protein ASA1KI_22320 [Opitutales bacterium ASA1]